MSQGISLKEYREQRFESFLATIKEGNMPDPTGWEFTRHEDLLISRAMDTLKDKPNYNEKAWKRWYLNKIEFRIR